MTTTINYNLLLDKIDLTLKEAGLPSKLDIDILGRLNDYQEMTGVKDPVHSGALDNFTSSNPISEFSCHLAVVAEDQAGPGSFMASILLGVEKPEEVELSKAPEVIQDFEAIVSAIRSGRVEGIPSRPDFSFLPAAQFLSQTVGSETIEDLKAYKEFASAIPLDLSKLPEFGEPSKGRTDLKNETAASFADQYIWDVYKFLTRRSESVYEEPRDSEERRSLRSLLRSTEAQTRNLFYQNAAKSDLAKGALVFEYAAADDEEKLAHPMRYENIDKESQKAAGQIDRAYITYDPTIQNLEIPFLQICSMLKDAGIKFAMKGVGPYGNNKRADSLVFYVNKEYRDQTDKLLSGYIEQEKIADIEGLFLSRSKNTNGLFWAIEPNKEQCEFAAALRGAEEPGESFHTYAAARIGIFYMHRLAEAHYNAGNRIFAQILNTELERILQIPH